MHMFVNRDLVLIEFPFEMHLTSVNYLSKSCASSGLVRREIALHSMI